MVLGGLPVDLPQSNTAGPSLALDQDDGRLGSSLGFFNSVPYMKRQQKCDQHTNIQISFQIID